MHKPLTTTRIAELAKAHTGHAQALADALVNAAITEPRNDPDQFVDNATAAVIALAR